MPVDEKREAIATATFQVKLTRVDPGPDVYSALIYIAGSHFGYVTRRRAGKYEAYTRTNRFLGDADSLTGIREMVVESYAATAEGTPAPPA